MLVRKTKGSSGIVKYLEDGVKAGRGYTRDELDHRVQISGDLNLLDATIKLSQKNKDWNSHYQHFTFGLTERDMEVMDKEPEKLDKLVQNYLDFYYGHHAKQDENDETYLSLVYSSELHLPKLKHLKNKTTGKLEKRYPHIHLVVSDYDTSTGLKLEPAIHNHRAMKAFQSWNCEELGLDDPADFMRADRSLTKGDLINRWKKSLQDGPELQRELLSELIIEQFTRTQSSENFRQDFKAALIELGVSKFESDSDGMTLSFDRKKLGVDNEIKPIKIQSHRIDGKPSHLTIDGYKPSNISAIKASRVSACMSDTEHGGLSQRQVLELFKSSRKKPKQTLRTHFRNEFSDLLTGLQTLDEVRDALKKLPCKFTQKPGKAIHVEIDAKALGINQKEPVGFNLRGAGFKHLHKLYWPKDKEKHGRDKTNKEIWKDDLVYRTENFREKNKDRVTRNPIDDDELQALRDRWFKSRTKTSKVLFYIYKQNFHLSDTDDFHTFKKGNERYLVNHSDKVQVIDKDDKIVVATDTDVAMQKGVRIALLLAKSKGWDMGSLNINGNARFQDAVKKEIELIKQQEAEGKLFDAPPTQVPADKPKSAKVEKKEKSARKLRDTVTSSARKDVLAKLNSKRPTNEIAWFNQNVKPQAVLDHCILSDKILMDPEKFEVKRDRIRPVGTTQKGLNVYDFLMRQGHMTPKAVKATLDLITQDENNLKDKTLPRPIGNEAKKRTKQSSAPQTQQKEETKAQPAVKTEKPGHPAPTAPVQPAKPVQKTPEDLSFIPDDGKPVMRNVELEEKNELARRIQRLRDIPKPIFDAKIAQLGGNSKANARNVHAKFIAAKPSTDRDIAQLENLVKTIDVNKIYPATWSQYERKIFHAGIVVPGIKNDDGHELGGEEQKIIFGRLKNNYESNNSSLKQPK